MERTGAIFVWIALIAGTLLTCWGLAHMAWPNALPWWGGGAITTYTAFMAICAALVIAGSLLSKRSALLTGAIVGIGIATLAGAIWPLLVTLWFAVASALLGRAILGLLRLRFEGDSWLTSLLVGAGFYGVTVGLIAHFPVSYPGLYGVALALPIILGWRTLVKEGGELSAQAAQKNVDGINFNGLDVAITVVGLVHFVVAFMPEVGADALAIHLFVPGHLALRHQWGFDASLYVWAVNPMLGDWIFSVGYMLAGETATRLINVGFIFILGWLARDLALWAGASAQGARWAALIFLSSPIAFTESSSLFIESVWASFVVLGILAVLRACSTSGKPKYDAPIATLLFGFALTSKAVTFPMLLAVTLVVILRYRSWYKAISLPTFFAGLVLALAIAQIPYTTAWILTGNPVFPYFNKVFKSPLYPGAAGDEATAMMYGKGLTWDILYKGTFDSGNYLEAKAGAPGFQWLLLFAPGAVALVLARQLRAIALLILGTLIVALVFRSVSYFRYIFPVWPIMAAVIGVALSAALSKGTSAKIWWRGAAVGAVALNVIFLNSAAQFGDFPLKAIGDKSRRERYLLNRLPIRTAVELVNQLNTGRTPVAVFSYPSAAGLSADPLFPNWYNIAFQKEIMAIQNEQNAVDVFSKRNVDFIILDSNWNGANCCPDNGVIQGHIMKVTEQVAEFGSISIRKIKADYRFKKELLINPDFASSTGWTLSGEAKYDADRKVILVNVSSSAIQVVAVSAGQRYRNTVVARCAKEPTTGRIQINWLDAKGQFVNVDIKTFECSPDLVEHSMEVTVPLTAANAIVYVTGHTSIPLEFKSNSLRQ
ncbi:MAG: glycosyl transferase [Nitrospinae bacterium]|nr:glycosyl transferase [Nitrospinota bacterium]